MEYVVKRNIQPWLVDLMGTFAAVEVTGARQVGKTTLAEMVSRHLDVEALMLTLDDPEVLGLAQSDPRGFIEQGRGKVLIIDEFQRAPQLALPLKAAIDRDRTPGQFIITGISRIASTDSADSLAGRVINCELRGFSQGEIRGVKEDFVARVLAGLKPSEECSDLSRSDYVDILCRGSMPEVQKLDPRMMETWFRSFLDRVAAKDLQDIGGSSDSRRVLSLLRAIAATQGSEIVVGRMANLANIPATTAAEYVSLLRQVSLVDVIAP